ncbi:MAG TPA: sigma-70 family RNA polymerase sigma factor [Anaerolineales bacterium]|nr:sigma-70 family RNA polymerase sigma factor [Anaerolineales bacterium]
MRDIRATRQDPPLPEESRLVERAKAGDPQAFTRLYDAYVERVSRYIYFRVSDERDIEDLVSQVFLKAWENLDRYQPGGSPLIAWLYTIARNLVIDHYRTKKNVMPLEEAITFPSDMEMPDDIAQTRFDLEAMRDGLQALNADQQQALILKYIAGLPNDSIAKIMNKQEGTVRGLQMRGLQTLAKYMKQKEAI